MQNRISLSCNAVKSKASGRLLAVQESPLRSRRRRRFRSILPSIYRNTRIAVLVRTRPRLAEARAVKAVHPRVLRTRDNGTSASRRSNGWSSSHCRRVHRNLRLFKTGVRSLQSFPPSCSWPFFQAKNLMGSDFEILVQMFNFFQSWFFLIFLAIHDLPKSQLQDQNWSPQRISKTFLDVYGHFWLSSHSRKRDFL